MQRIISILIGAGAGCGGEGRFTDSLKEISMRVAQILERSISLGNPKKWRFHLGIISIALLALSCAGTSATPLPDTAQAEGAVFFVENHGDDARQLEQIIVETLRKRGLDAVGGAKETRPENTDFLVSYEDRWAWDMRTYLRLIQIDVQNVRTGEIVATSRSHQDSLTAMGKTHEEIIGRTTNQLLDGAP
jgi:hypothetical protein